MNTLTDEQWRVLSARLLEPFDPKEVDFRVQGRASEQTGKAQVVAYVDARVVQDRLDTVVGAGNWAFDWTPLVIDSGEVQVAKGTLTVYGVSKSDAGSASNFEQSLGAVSHCFKRAAVHWGIGRYLYNLPMAWVPVERGRISDATLNELRGRLPRPGGAAEQKPGQPAPAREAVAQAPAGAESRQNGGQPTRPDGAPTRAPAPTPTPTTPTRTTEGEPPATDQQLASIRKLCAALGKPTPADGEITTFAQAKVRIIALSGEYQKARKAPDRADAAVH